MRFLERSSTIRPNVQMATDKGLRTKGEKGRGGGGNGDTTDKRVERGKVEINFFCNLSLVNSSIPLLFLLIEN